MILLVDMDAFFASVEQAHHPHLVGSPVIICGDPGRRGVVTAASYEARPFGIRAGMALGEARSLCPQAEYLEGNPDKYVAISLQLLDLYLRFTPDVEPVSVDEAFVALKGRDVTMASALEIGTQIQLLIAERFRLPASIGIGPNKLIAKMAAGLRKPRGLTALDERGFRKAFSQRDIQELWGVGPKLATRMRSLGFKTVGELARAPDPILKAEFGIIGPQLKQAAWGKDDTPVIPYHRGVDAKSMGHEVTLTEDCSEPTFLAGALLRLADQVARRLRGEGYVGRVVSVKLRNRHFETRIRQRALDEFTNDHVLIYEVAHSLLSRNWNGEPLRLIGVSVSRLDRKQSGDSAELFLERRRSHELRETLDRIRDRLGEAIVVPAGTLTHRRGPPRHVPFGSAPALAIHSARASGAISDPCTPPPTES